MVTASLEICQLRCKNRPDDPATRQEDSGRLIPNAALTEEQLQLIVSNFKKLQPKSIGWKILSTQTGTLVVQEKSPQDPCRVISNPS